MTHTNDETELSVGPKAIDAYSRLSYTMWFALAEFVDNSTQSRLNYDSVVDQLLQDEGRPLTVSIVHDRQFKQITIEDNSIGMTKSDLIDDGPAQWSDNTGAIPPLGFVGCQDSGRRRIRH